MKELIDVVKARNMMVSSQNAFKKKVKELFPFINSAAEPLVDVCEMELNTLLSSCLKFTTSRFRLKSDPAAADDYYDLILTQNPGLRQPRSSYPNWEWKEVTSIRNNMFIRGLRKEDKSKVNLSDLVDNPKIHQEKLKLFYNKIREFIKVRKDLNLESGNKGITLERTQTIVNGNSEITAFFKLENDSFELSFSNKKKDLTSFSDLYDISDFDRSGFDENETKLSRGSYNSEFVPTACLSFMAKHWNKLSPVFAEMNDAKKAELGTLQIFIDSLKQENAGFKLLKGLTDKNKSY